MTEKNNILQNPSEPKNPDAISQKVDIRVENLTGGYGGGEIILRDVSFDIQKGEIFVILGGSGCGKSTLMKFIIGLVPPLQGKIFLKETDIANCSPEEMLQVLKRCGILFQSAALFGSMTIGENISLPLQEFTDLSAKEIDCLVKMKLALVNLQGYENHYPNELSGGMKKRAGLARALALNPEVLFFDEPSAGLDPVTSAELDRLILHINKTFGTTMVIVTHELQSIFTIADRVIMLDKRTKGIIATGKPVELKEKSLNPYVRQFFNRQPDIDYLYSLFPE